MSQRIVVNGRSVTVSAADDTPLLWVLREELGLTGAKYGCGVALCGACTVHVDGQAVRACQTPVGAVGDAKVTTVEGLGADHPVIRAWTAESVAQCGYCQPGQVMSAAALLAATPTPSDAEIVAAMDGNICRCGTYLRIKTAIRRAAGLIAGART